MGQPSTDIGDTLGAILMGALVSAVLSGTVLMQTVVYFRTYFDDSLRNKFMVALVWMLDALHTALIWTSIWTYLIGNWGNSAVFDHIPWTISLTIVLTGISTFIVNCFLTYRIHLLSFNCWYLTTPIVVCAAVRLGATLVSTSKMIELQSYMAFKEKAGWLLTLGLSVSSLVDIVVTVVLTALLLRSRTGYSTSTDRLIDTIVIYTIETGMVTCVATIATLACWVAMPSNLIFLALHFTISKLYSNSILATLNARKSLRRRTRQSTDRVASLPVVTSNRNHTNGTRSEREDHDLDNYLAVQAKMNGSRNNSDAPKVGPGEST
ncbi:hypothetical protein AcV5_005387 [Taiwanofungus camphoratus]|nr:hypothetical protein AcV5_005387 [Antrodia cinnamomea]